MSPRDLIANVWMLVVCSLIVVSCHSENKDTVQKEERYYSISDYTSVPKIDAHVHIRTKDTAFVHQAREDNFRLLSIVVEESPGMDFQYECALQQTRDFPDRVAFATTFSIADWGEEDWEIHTIAGLQRSLDDGAAAVKVYKIIGMELQNEAGEFVMIDDDSFRPVFQFLDEKKLPVIGHLGEPRNCWLPIEEMTVASDKRYFARHPEFHMYLHPEYPSYEEQLEARDHVLEQYPDLPFVGAHFGSIEWSTDELARRLDAYPNFAVDMAARISSLQYQTMEDRDRVRDFMIKYQDRLLYGTDRIADEGEDMEKFRKFLHEAWLRDWEYFCTDHPMTSGSFEGEFSGLKLPAEVIDKIYFQNAITWFPKLGFH